MISMATCPSAEVKAQPFFSPFQSACERRFNFLVDSSLASWLEPLLKADKVAEFLAKMSPDSKTGDALSVEYLNATAASVAALAMPLVSEVATKCQKLLAELPYDKLKERAVELPAGGIHGPVWLICFMPSCLSIVKALAGVYLLQQAVSDGDAARAMDPLFCEDFARAANEFDKMLTAVKAQLADSRMPLTVTAANSGIMVVLDKAAERWEAIVNEVAKLWISKQSQFNVSLGDLLARKEIADTERLINEGCPDNLDSLLANAQSVASRDLHNMAKQFEVDLQCRKLLQGLKLAPDTTAELMDLDLSRTQPKRLNVTMAVIQALSRPLKATETRGALARRARLMVGAKEIQLPAALDLYLNKVAAG